MRPSHEFSVASFGRFRRAERVAEQAAYRPAQQGSAGVPCSLRERTKLGPCICHSLGWFEKVSEGEPLDVVKRWKPAFRS